jgi:hypothetical protein
MDDITLAVIHHTLMESIGVPGRETIIPPKQQK